MQAISVTFTSLSWLACYADITVRCEHQHKTICYKRLGCAGGRPLVVEDPTCAASQAYMQLGAAVVTEVAKLQAATRPTVRWAQQCLPGILGFLRACCCHASWVICSQPPLSLTIGVPVTQKRQLLTILALILEPPVSSESCMRSCCLSMQVCRSQGGNSPVTARLCTRHLAGPGCCQAQRHLGQKHE